MAQRSPQKETLCKNLTTILQRKGIFGQCTSRYLREIATNIDNNPSEADEESQSLVVELILQFLDKHHLLDSLSVEDIQKDPDLIQKVLDEWVANKCNDLTDSFNGSLDNEDPLRKLLKLMENNIRKGKDPLANLETLRKNFTVPTRKITHPELLDASSSDDLSSMEFGLPPKQRQDDKYSTKSSPAKGMLSSASKSSKTSKVSAKSSPPTRRKVSPSNSPSSNVRNSPKNSPKNSRTSSPNHTPIATVQHPVRKISPSRLPIETNLNSNDLSTSSSVSNEKFRVLKPKKINKPGSRKTSPGRASSPNRYTFGMKPSENSPTSKQEIMGTPQNPNKVVRIGSPAKTEINNGVIEITPEPIKVHRKSPGDKKSKNINIELSIRLARNPPPGSPGGVATPSVMVSPTKTIKRKNGVFDSDSTEVITEEIVAYIPRPNKNSPEGTYSDLPNVIPASTSSVAPSISSKASKSSKQSRKSSKSKQSVKANDNLFLSASSTNSADSEEQRSKVMSIIKEIRQTSPRLPKMKAGFSNALSSSTVSSAVDSSAFQKRNVPKVDENDNFTTDEFNHVSDYEYKQPSPKFTEKKEPTQDKVSTLSSSEDPFPRTKSSKKKGHAASPTRVGRQMKSPSKIKKIYSDQTAQTANNIATQTTDEPPTILYLTTVEGEFDVDDSYLVTSKIAGNDEIKFTKLVKGKTPRWNKRQTFRVMHLFTDVLELVVTKGNNKEYAKLSIPLKKVSLDEYIDAWFDLSPDKAGRIHLEMSAAADYGTEVESESDKQSRKSKKSAKSVNSKKSKDTSESYDYVSEEEDSN